MNILKKISQKSIKAKYFNEHKTSYIIIRIFLFPIILIVMILQAIAEITDKLTTLLGGAVNRLSYFLFKALHYKNLPERDDDDE